MLIGSTFKKNFFSTWNYWLKLKFQYINYGNILANEIAYKEHIEYHFNTSSKDLIKNILKNLLRKNSYSNYNFKHSTSQEIIFFGEEDNRQDYKNQCEFVLNSISDLSFCEVEINKIKKYNYKRTSASDFLQKIFLLISSTFNFCFSQQKLNKINFNKFLYFFNLVLYYFDQVKLLDQSIDWRKVKVIITFSDMKEYSNIATQLAKKHNVISLTQQHAVYSVPKENAFSQAAINYLNFNSNYLLGWGEAVAHTLEQVNISDDKILQAGTNVKSFQERINYETLDKTYPQKKIGLILSAEYWKKSNLSILKIANQLAETEGYKVEVLFHPSNNIDEYKSKYSFINNFECFQKISNTEKFILDQTFLICHTTTLYFLSLLKGRKCFRYVDDEFIDLYGIDDKFNDMDELQIKLKNYIITEDLSIEINNLFDFQFGKENNYSNIIRQFI